MNSLNGPSSRQRVARHVETGAKVLLLAGVATAFAFAAQAVITPLEPRPTADEALTRDQRGRCPSLDTPSYPAVIARNIAWFSGGSATDEQIAACRAATHYLPRGRGTSSSPNH